VSATGHFACPATPDATAAFDSGRDPGARLSHAGQSRRTRLARKTTEHHGPAAVAAHSTQAHQRNNNEGDSVQPRYRLTLLVVVDWWIHGTRRWCRGGPRSAGTSHGGIGSVSARWSLSYCPHADTHKPPSSGAAQPGRASPGRNLHPSRQLVAAPAYRPVGATGGPTGPPTRRAARNR